MVHWPAGITAQGELRHTPGHIVDVAPTILEVAGVKKPKRIDGTDVPTAPGRSLLSAFAADVQVERDSFWWLHEGNKAVRVGDWKLVAAENDRWELYDLSTDRTETNNLADQYPQRVRELEQVWQRQHDQCQRLATQDLKR